MEDLKHNLRKKGFDEPILHDMCEDILPLIAKALGAQTVTVSKNSYWLSMRFQVYVKFQVDVEFLGPCVQYSTFFCKAIRNIL